MTKQQLYNQIMKDVSRIILEHIDERKTMIFNDQSSETILKNYNYED